ncbi:MAG: lysophospholipid acyltransferase family protein [Bacteroidota bacterium]
MRWLIRLLHILYALYAMVVFVLLMLPVFIYVLLVIPFGKIKGGNLAYAGCKLWADVWFALIFVRHKNIFIEPLQKDAAYIFVANHISYFDSAVIPKAFRQPIRPLGKVEMAKVPVFGLIYKNVIVTVDRSSAANRARSVADLKTILKHRISILVFPEGTFNTTDQPLKEFYDGAFRIAIETGSPIKPVLLLDTYSRMNPASIFSLNPGGSRAIFLPQFAVDNYTVDDVSVLKTKVYSVMENALREYKADWIRE